jgi:diadenosine tetraphosphate (Ap4A) HIT family hydrolase
LTIFIALDNSGLNVVCNQEYAQAVPHVHYHVIPAPVLASSPTQTPLASPEKSTPLSSKEMHKAEFESREELDEDDAEQLLKMIKAKL